MMKRLRTLIIAVALAIISAISCSACNENQVETYISRILFGQDTPDSQKPQKADKAKMLLDGIYLCCEQNNGSGIDKLNYLHNKGVRGTSSIVRYDIPKEYLIECSHTAWSYQSFVKSDIQKERRQLLQRVVKDTFDFGFINETFYSGGKKCESFAQFLYYLHILADYLADDPSAGVDVGDLSNATFSGQPDSKVYENQPTIMIKKNAGIEPSYDYSMLDSERCGPAYALITKESLSSADSRQNTNNIYPSGWNQAEYPSIISSKQGIIYNKCHLIAHELGGSEQKENIITGTWYLNAYGMKTYEGQISRYVKSTSEPVLYRVTPIYKGSNLVASGVQMEAYSILDNGAGLHFNVYCYNVQPGIHIDYQYGVTSLEDQLTTSDKAIPFVREGATEEKPDLIYEISRTVSELFDDRYGEDNYQKLQQKIKEIAIESKSLENDYLELKNKEHALMETLTIYVPLLLNKEKFFNSAFG